MSSQATRLCRRSVVEDPDMMPSPNLRLFVTVGVPTSDSASADLRVAVLRRSEIQLRQCMLWLRPCRS